MAFFCCAWQLQYYCYSALWYCVYRPLNMHMYASRVFELSIR
jgi:hypothetical protein